MPKPTLWQSILGKPSQAYSFPPENAYFSSKQDMLRIASEVEQQRLRQQIQSIEALQQATQGLPSRAGGDNPVPPVTRIDPLAGRKRDNDTHHHHREERNDYERNNDRLQSGFGSDYRTTVMIDEEEDDGNMSDTSEDDVFYTPNTSPRMSVASTRSGGSSARLGRRSPGTSRKSSRRSLKMTAMSRQLSAGSATNSEASASKTGGTPLRPPARAKTEIDSIPDKTHIHGAIAGQHQKQSSFGRGHTSTSTSPDVYTLPSQPMSSSARTSAHRSDFSRDREKNVGQSTLARNDTQYEAGADMDEDDGWLIASNDPIVPRGPSSKRKPVPAPPLPNGNAGHAPPRKSNKIFKTMSKANPSIMMNMTALMEEDEDVLMSSSPNARAFAHRSHPQSNVLVVQQESSRTSSKPTLSSTYPSPDDSFRSTLHATATSTPDTSLSSSKSRDTATNGSKYDTKRNSNLRHRRSRSHDDLRSSSRSGSHSRSVSVTELASLPIPSGDLPSQGTPGFTSLVLPRAPPPSALSARSQGPKLDPSTDGKIDLTRSGIAQTTMATVEVVHGLGATAKTGKGLLGALGRKMSLSKRKTAPVRTSSDRPRVRRSEDHNAATGTRELNAHQPLGFTSYRKPPDYVPSSCVLVQVWAVGADGVDARLVGLRLGGRSSNSSFRPTNIMNGNARKGGSLRWKFVRSAVVSADQELQQPLVGYIPGRSFVGRVLECGWGVEDDIVKKGDWVVGLLDVRKAGALSEFIVVDKRRVYRVPHPKISGMSLKALGKQPERKFSGSSRSPAWGLTLEELALLPLCGVPAYRAVRTLVYAFSTSPTKDSITESHRIMSTYGSPEMDPGTGRRRRALVLRGHDGVGAMAVRLLIAKGWDVSIHAPCPYPAESEEGDAYMASVEERARAWGCDEIIFDDGIEAGGDEGRGAVVRVLERLWRDGDLIDAVLDTVGGKEVWEASERVLKLAVPPEGGNRTLTKKSSKGYAQFTTLVGDSPSRVVPSASDLFKAGVRSLRMGGKPSGGYKDDGPNSPGKTSGGSTGERKVGYAWVGTAQDVDWEGQNISESIAAVLKLALEGIAKPWIGSPNDDERVVPFERAPEVFIDDGPLSQGSTVIVKIVE